MVLEVASNLNGSVVSEREYSGSLVMSLKMQVIPCCLQSCSQAGMGNLTEVFNLISEDLHSTRELLSNKNTSFLPGHMCSTTNKTGFVWRIPCWKQCIESVEGSR